MKTLSIILAVLLFIVGINALCPLHCTTCSTSTSCSNCEAGFFLVNNTFCPPCPSGCTSCSLTSTSTVPICTACASPAQLSSTGTCFVCDPSCQTCSGKPNNCTSCKEGLQLNSTTVQVNSTNQTVTLGVCVANSSCTISSCVECSLDSNNFTFCSKCKQGSFAFKRKCYPCRFSCNGCIFNFTQLWARNISQFWDRAIRTAFNITTATPPSGTIPPFMNNLNWSNMTQEVRKNWFEAYFIFRAIQPILTNLNITLTRAIMEAVNFFPSIQNLTSMEVIQKAILTKINTITQKNFTGEELDEKEAQVAANLTLCINCTLGFQNATTPVSTCVTCAANCLNCTTGSCTQCAKKYFLSSGVCTACASNCASCQSTSTNCSSCVAPLSLSSSGTCISCQQPCLTCSASNLSSCVTCKKPYSSTANSTGGCYRCQQDLCVRCKQDNTSVCFQCANGTTLLEGKCQTCPVSCSSCSSATTTTPSVCFECFSGFVIVNNSCVKCGPGCLKCSTENSSICLQCQTGTFLNATIGFCQRCRQGCNVCTGPQACTSFSSGVVIVGNQTVKCRPGCQVCNTSSPDMCLTCQSRYFLVSGNCKSCGIGCQKCTTQITCTKCLDNLILSSGSCLKCEGSCRTCNPSNLTQCLSCIRGTTLNGTKCVFNCSVGCLECNATNSSVCLKCNQGHALKSTGQCVKCLGTCSGSCDPRNISLCLSCVNGFELIGNQCVRCSPGCATCLNGQCSLCVSGFNLVQNSTGSFYCQQKCISPCSQCSTGVCTACQSGYTLSSQNCVPDLSCNPNCAFCPSGTEKASDGSCISCPTNCSTCSSGVCSQCIPGMFLNRTDSQCTVCPPQCKTCYNNDSCDQCSSGYVKEIVSMTTGVQDAVYSDKCIPCDSNCKTCIIQPDRCTSCFDGYRLFSFRCAGMFTVVYQYELNIDYQTFINNSESQNFMEKISNMSNVNSTENYITYVRQGSTVVGGTISASSQASASSIQSSLGSGVSGYTILSSSASVYYADSPYQTTSQQTPSTNNLGIIIGASVGGVVLIAVIVFLVYKLKTRKITAVDRQQISVQQISDSRGNQQNKSSAVVKSVEQKQLYYD